MYANSMSPIGLSETVHADKNKNSGRGSQTHNNNFLISLLRDSLFDINIDKYRSRS